MNSKNKETLAIPFISYHEGTGFKLSPEAEQFLLNLPENRKLAVISIVGKYRTGKSFFVNRVLLDQKKGGFQVGPTINPCTKGLWLWKKTVQSPNDEDLDVILIDTEGFGGMDENANHDSRIFLFSLLLSSYFIYNSQGSIDENALNTLNLIINLAKDIQTKSNNSSQDPTHFPSFLWVIRDFTLQMVGKNGENITSREYLQNALELLPGNTTAIQNKNKIRRLLRHFFQKRDCESMVRPVESQRDLQRLDEMNNSQLRPEFVSQVFSIRKKIYENVEAKKLNGKQLNGHLLVALCKGYMEAINNNMVPNIESAWYYVCRSEGRRAIEKAIQHFDQRIQEFISKPLSKIQLLKLQEQLREEVKQKFRRKSMGAEESQPELLEKLEKKIEEGLKQLQQKNANIWAREFRDKSERVREVIRDMVFRDEFDNFADFQECFEKMKIQYDEETKDCDEEEKWKHFNEITHDVFRLAGQSITNKFNRNLESQKKILEQKLKNQAEELSLKSNQDREEKNQLKTKVEELQLLKTRLQASEQTSTLRINQYKTQYQKLQQKNKKVEMELEQKVIEVQKLRKKETQNAHQLENDLQQAKNEISMLKNAVEKDKALFEMEKKYLQEEFQIYKEKADRLQHEAKKLRANYARLSTENEQLVEKSEQYQRKVKALTSENSTLQKKIQNLTQENLKKSQMVGQQNEIMLQKAYLQNQVSFLKNTLNENKRLHDQLLVALQKSIAEPENQCNSELIEANKNMSVSLEKMEQRCKILEEKYEKVKSLKKLFKNCSAVQCSHCNKWVQSSTFSAHLDQCGENVSSLREKTLPDIINKQALHISVSQNIVKELEGSTSKPRFEYIIQMISNDKKWKVVRHYKQFTELSQNLIKKFPSIKFPTSFTSLADSKMLISKEGAKKNMGAEERRKNIQLCLRDLSKIEEIRGCGVFREFLQLY